MKLTNALLLGTGIFLVASYFNKNTLITQQQATQSARDYTSKNNYKNLQQDSATLIQYANEIKATGETNLDVFNKLVATYNNGLVNQQPDRANLFAPNIGGYFPTPYGVVNDQTMFDRPTADSNGNITFPLITKDLTIWLNGNSSQSLSNLDGVLGAQQMIARGLYTVHTT